MGKCINHPEIETSYKCMKHNIYQCDQCLECRDPDLYCKFRTSCPIHFISKKGFDSPGKERPDINGQRELETCTVVFSPGDVSVNVPKGSTLLEAAEKADIYINASCNGKGSCGKCRLILKTGKVENKPTPLLERPGKEKGLCFGMPDPYSWGRESQSPGGDRGEKTPGRGNGKGGNR